LFYQLGTHYIFRTSFKVSYSRLIRNSWISNKIPHRTHEEYVRL